MEFASSMSWQDNIIEIYSDGASKGNPGPAGAAAVIFMNGKKLTQVSKYLGIRTNNFAEYAALILAFKYLLKNKSVLIFAKEIRVFADSKLLIEQASGNWKVKNENIKKLFELLKSVEKELGIPVKYKHINREKNSLADSLANKAICNR